MKKITILLLAVLIFYVPCMTAYAETPEQKGATISAAVPATHVITFISSGGRIEDVDSTVGGHKEYGRRSEQPFHIIPDDGKEIDKVLTVQKPMYETIVFRRNKIEHFFPDGMTGQEIERTIIRLLERYQREWEAERLADRER